METLMRAILLVSAVALVSQIGTAAAHDAWFVRVCPTKTEASRVYIQFAGARRAFGWMWTRGKSPNERALPDRFRTAGRVYVRGQTMAQTNKQQPHAYVCLGYRDHIVQRLEFDDHVDYEKNWNDTDDCAC
jgi:hypothetical protein